MTEEEKAKQEEATRKATRIARIIVFVLALLFLGGCVKLCSDASRGGGDDTWGRLDRSVHSDPYYKHWD